MDDLQPAVPQPDHRFGHAGNPDEYRLREWVDKPSSEGQIWRATTVRQNKGSTGRDELEQLTWAVKIIDGRSSIYRDDQTLREALDDLAYRYRSAMRETAQMMRSGIPGIAGPTEVFIGGAPHPLGQPGASAMLYVVSDWIRGDNLLEWRRKNPPRFKEVCGLLDQLAITIDGFANWELELVHRDIAPENVMVAPGGQPTLIDFTYARPPDSAGGTQSVIHRGYTPPEARFSEYGLAGDRYSFGAVAYFLLSGAEPPPVRNAAAACRATLVGIGFTPELAAHVAALLHEDPAARPKGLIDWADRLRKLGARPGPPAPHQTLALTVDGTAAPVVVAGSRSGTYRARLATGMTWQLARDPGSPDGIEALAAVTDGSGSPVTFAATSGGKVFAGRAGMWADLGPCTATAGICANRDAHGAATAYVVAPATRTLETITVGLDGAARRAPGRHQVSQVLAAVADRDGSTAVMVLLPGGQLACVTPDGVGEISPAGAFSAAGCLDNWGELRCYRVLAGARSLGCFDRSTGRWSPMPDAEVELPFAATQVACAGHRDGVTVAIAGSGGICVASHGDHFGPWRRLAGRPSSQLSLAMGAAWRLHLTALVDGRPGFVSERSNGWPAHLDML